MNVSVSTFDQYLDDLDARLSELSARNVDRLSQLEAYLSVLDRLDKRFAESQSMRVASGVRAT
jgi:hypothetical protein